jgi:hypothetical protein
MEMEFLQQQGFTTSSKNNVKSSPTPQQQPGSATNNPLLINSMLTDDLELFEKVSSNEREPLVAGREVTAASAATHENNATSSSPMRMGLDRRRLVVSYGGNGGILDEHGAGII